MPKIKVPLFPSLVYDTNRLDHSTLSTDYYTYTGPGLINGVANITQSPSISPVCGSTAVDDASGRTNGWGCYHWQISPTSEVAYSVFDYFVYEGVGGTLASIGDFNTAGGTTGVGRVFWAEGYTGGNRTLFISAPGNGSYGELFYITSAATTTLNNVSDAQYPGNASYTVCGGVVALDGYIFVMTTDGKIWNSDLNDGTSWTATGYITAEMEDDVGVYLAKYRNHIVAFGSRTTEFFYNAGNPTDSPLSPRRDIAFNVGAIVETGTNFTNQQVDAIGDTIAWVGSDLAGEVGIYTIDNYQPKKISTDQIDKKLKFAHHNTGGVFSIRIITMGGRVFAHLAVSHNGTAYDYLLYDFANEYWSVLNGIALADRIQGFSVSKSPAIYDNEIHFVKFNSNKLWEMKPEQSYDDTNTTTNETKTLVVMGFNSDYFDQFTSSNKKFLNSVHIEAEGITTSTNSTGVYYVQNRLAAARFADGSNDYFRFGMQADKFRLSFSISEDTDTTNWNNYKIRNIEIDIDEGIQT